MGLFKKEKRFSLEDIKQINEIVEEKKARATRSNDGDFFDKMRKYKDFEKQMTTEKEDEIADIIKRYGVEPGAETEGGEVEDVAIKQLIPLFTKFLNKNPQKPPNSATSPEEGNQTTLNTKPDLLATPELVELAREKVLKLVPKKYKSNLKEELSQLSDNDIINLKRSIEESDGYGN